MKAILKTFTALSLLFVFVSISHAEIDINKMKPGTSIFEAYNGLPILIYKRTEEEIKTLLESPQIKFNSILYANTMQHFAKLHGNELASKIFSLAQLNKTSSRSIRNDVLITIGISTNFGCLILTNQTEPRFTDPCSKASYDTSGRIIQANDRENYHLLIPPHHFLKNTLKLGFKETETAPIIDFSPDINSMKISSGEKLLLALEWGKNNLISELLEDLDVLKYETQAGATALHVAASKSKPQIINMLIEAGFDVNIPTKEGVTAIQLALISENNETASLLLKNNAKTNQYCVGDRCADSVVNVLSKMMPYLTRNDIEENLLKLKNN